MKTINWVFLASIITLLTFGSFGIGTAKATGNNNQSDKFLIPQDKGRYGSDSAKCVENLSLYREFFKQWKASDYKNAAIKDAIGPWRYVFNNCPQASQYTNVDGLSIMEFYLKTAKDDKQKAGYVDTIMMLYDNRIKYFGKEGYILGRKGSDLFKYIPEDYEKAYYMFKKSVELQGNNSESFVLVYYFRTASKMVDAEKVDKGTLVEIYDNISGIIGFNLEAKKDKADEKAEWENVKGNIDLSFEPYATCENLIDIFTKKFNETPDNIELLKKITNILDKKDCTDSQLFFDASVKLNELEPSPESSYMIAKMLLKKEKNKEAIPYLESASNIENDNIKKSEVFLVLASVYFESKDYQSSRSYARKSIELKPDQGKAYLLIGDMYAASAESCGDNDLSKKAAYWAAVDKYIEAKRADPTVEEYAQKLIDAYSRQFPIMETLFFYNVNVGDSYTVGCWINEKTTIRVAR